MGAFLGLLPAPILRFIVKNSVGKSWSSSAIEALCTHVLKVELMFFLIYVVVYLRFISFAHKLYFSVSHTAECALYGDDRI